MRMFNGELKCAVSVFCSGKGQKLETLHMSNL